MYILLGVGQGGGETPPVNIRPVISHHYEGFYKALFFFM
jgi:hypothetical protein